MMRLVVCAVLTVGAGAAHIVPLSFVQRSRLRAEDVARPTLHIQETAVGKVFAPHLLPQSNLVEFPDTLQDLQNNIYVVEAEIGSEPVKVRLIIDTGSSDLWTTRKLNSSTMQTAKGSNVTLKYGKGEVAGTVVFDRFCIGALCNSNETLLLPTSTNDLEETGFDGLLGLAFPLLMSENAYGRCFLDQLEHSGSFKQLSFGLSLRGMAGDSFVAFGEHAELLKDARSNFSSLGATLPLYGVQVSFEVKPAYWMVGGDMGVGDYQLSQHHFVLDSGTSVLVVPHASFGDITDALRVRNQCFMPPSVDVYVCPCSTSISPMVLTFTGLNGSRFSVTLGKDELIQAFDTPVGTFCRLGIMSVPKTMEKDLDFVILGDVFLRQVYVLHDYTNKKVTLFARKDKQVREPTVEVPIALYGIQPSEQEKLSGSAEEYCSWAVSLAFVMLVLAVAVAYAFRRGCTVTASPSIPGVDGTGYERL